MGDMKLPTTVDIKFGISIRKIELRDVSAFMLP